MPADLSPLHEKLLSAAGRKRMLRFDEFQEISLYDPEHGYYSRSAERAGRQGDFLTAPEVSPLFAQCLAKAVRDDEANLAADEFHLLEMGAGRGRLARDLWESLRFHPVAKRIHFHLVERSPAARAALTTTLAEIPRERWTSYADEDALPSRPWPAGLIIANELFDNLPVRRVMQTNCLKEIVLRIQRRGLREDLVDAPLELAAYLEAQGVHLTVGQSAEVCLEAPNLLARILARFERGSCLIIDYGDEAKRLYDPERFPHGSLAAHRGHATHTDYYRDLGGQDLTAHVNFTPLLSTLEAAGYRIQFFGTQMKFLLAQGIVDLLQQRLEKADDEFERLRWNQRAKQLFHPDLMGEAFRVIHARTP